MAKYACPYCPIVVHTSGGIPNPNEWLVLSAAEHDGLSESVTAEEIYSISRMLYRRVSCDAIAIFWPGFSEEPTWYAPRQHGGAN